MAGIPQLDAMVKTIIELGLQDIKDNVWLVDHILSDYVDNQYLQSKYGQKNIDACKEWLLNNNIEIALRPRNDKDQMPLITITPGPEPEKDEYKSMADQSTESVVLLPNQINKPIAYIVKPFTPIGYDPETGLVEIDLDTKGLDTVSVGMILVNPSNGQGYSIIDIAPEGVLIEPGHTINATQLAIVPQFQYYVARVEHTWRNMSSEVGIYCHGEPQATLWLHDMVLYSLFRYRESLLEANNIAETNISSSALMEDPYYSGPNGEGAYVRSIQISGVAELKWIKSPRRIVENVGLREKTSAGYIGGIKVLSNLDSPDFIDETQEPWTTVKE